MARASQALASLKSSHCSMVSKSVSTAGRFPPIRRRSAARTSSAPTRSASALPLRADFALELILHYSALIVRTLDRRGREIGILVLVDRLHFVDAVARTRIRQNDAVVREPPFRRGDDDAHWGTLRLWERRTDRRSRRRRWSTAPR